MTQMLYYKGLPQGSPFFHMTDIVCNAFWDDTRCLYERRNKLKQTCLPPNSRDTS